MVIVAFLFGFAIYLAAFYLIACLFNRYCQRRGKNTLGKLISWFIMFLAVAIVFWDAIPTWYTHDHLCHAEFGLTVYMTPDEWAKKHPERFAKIKPASEDSSSEIRKNSRVEISIEHLNSDFNSVTEREMGYGFGVMRERYQLVDSKTGQILVEGVDFAGGVTGGSIATGANSLADYKFWLTTLRCGFAYSDLRSKYESDNRTAGNIFNTVRGWGNK